MGRTCSRNEQYEISYGKPEIKRLLEINLYVGGRITLRWSVAENVDWIHLARGTVQW
jgi:hypothetical protein